MIARGTSEAALLCSEPGCCNRWTSNFGRRWCTAHDPGLSGHQPTKHQSALPLAIPAANFQPHWSDTDREQEVPF